MGRGMTLMGVPVMGGGAKFGYGDGTGDLPAAIYGVSWDKSALPALTRTDDAVGMVAAAGVDGGAVTNNFDTAAIFSEFTEETDADSNVFIRIPRFYIEKTDTPTSLTWRISKRGGGQAYLPACFWNFTTNTPLDYVDVGKYTGSISGGKLQSKASTYPTINTNIVLFRTAAQANGAVYQQLDIHAVDLLQTLMYIEFATLDLQAIMAGYTAGQYNAAHTLTADTTPAGNTLVVANVTGALYAVGQAISVGTSLGGNQKFYGRTITQIDVDTPGAGSTTITFDGDPVELATGNILYNTGWKNGFSSGIAATSGSLTSNSTGKYPCHYRGIENPYGNVWQFVDGLNINEFQSWVCRNAANYASNLFAAPYEQLSYVNHNANGYVTARGYDPSRPWAALPTAVSASGVGYKDYYYQSTGQRIALVGGVWFDGSGAGPSCFSLLYASAGAGVSISGRLVRKGS